jgi:hypothetical protein
MRTTRFQAVTRICAVAVAVLMSASAVLPAASPLNVVGGYCRGTSAYCSGSSQSLCVGTGCTGKFCECYGVAGKGGCTNGGNACTGAGCRQTTTCSCSINDSC